VPDPILIGHVAPLSGPDQAVGRQARQGVQLAIDEARAADRKLLGRSFVAVHVDGKGEVDLTRAETVRLLAVNRVSAMVGSANGEAADVIVRESRYSGAPVAIAGEVAGVSLGDGAVALGAGPEARGRLLARLATGKLGFRRLGVLTDSDDRLAAALASAFDREAQAAGATVEAYPCERESERTDAVAALARMKPGAVLVACDHRLFGRRAARLAEAGVKGSLLYGGEDRGTTGWPGAALDGPVYLATVFTPPALRDKSEDFTARYEKQFHEKPDLAAVEAFDATSLLITALVESGPSGLNRVREQLDKVKLDGAFGPIRFEKNRVVRPIYAGALKPDGFEALLTEGE
jgi:branched-chain amino acid transport system substrate-binding protein